MADISKLEQQADLLFNNVAGWENSTLQRIGKRIGKYGKMSLADVKAINNIAVVKQDMEAITKELAKVTGYNISQIEQMYGELLEEQHLANEPLYDYRGKKFVPFAENRELQAIARAYAKTTGDTMINLAKTKALCILDHNGNVKGLQRAYTDILDKSVMQVTSGATDFNTAMRDSIIELGGSGVRVDYGDKIVKGKKTRVTRRLDTVVRQNLLWGAKQASTEYNTMIGEELGCDGYEVDAHSSPRPSHMFVQGKQYCIGKSQTINGIKFIGFEETDPTSPDGKSASQALGEYGCLHYKAPILCGISEPRFSKEQLAQIEADNKKQYKVGDLEGNKYYFSQKMRSLETAIREQKDIKAVAQSSGDKTLVKRCNERIKAYQTKYNEISEITGIQGDKKRMSVPRGAAMVKGETLTKVEPPKLTFKKMETMKEAVDFGRLYTVSGEFNAEGLHLNTVNAFNEAAFNVEQRFGRKLRIKGIKSIKSMDAPYMQGAYNPNDMRISLKGGNSPNAMSSYQKHAEKYFSNGWLASKDAYGTFYHEIGHSVWYDLPKEAREEIVKIYKETKHSAYLQWMDMGGSRSGFSQADIFGKSLSRYALTDEHEFFSEAFSQIMSGRMRPVSRRINAILTKWYSVT